jgi:Asp-tRNA(Asn)/Glu-tRNA(Gln) amidotransferase B subunit
MAGRVMGAVMKAHKGRVDAQDVKPIVNEELAAG